jgi:2-hydroxychromene-2-carboxylate isomerase
VTDIDYYYAAHSAFAYIGDCRLHEVAAAAGERVIHKPFDLRRLMAAIGGSANLVMPQRRAYFFRREIERWATFREVPMRRGIPANHANDVTLANCTLIAAAEAGADVDALAFAVMQAHWRDGEDLADPATLEKAGAVVGVPAASFIEAAATERVRAIYDANTEAAIAWPMFGSPTYIVAGDMFYGQDHLDLVAQALEAPFPDTWPKD